MTHPWLTVPLLAAAVLLCAACSLGVLVMRDAYQRLHFTTPVAAVVAAIVAACVFIEDASPQSRTKTTFVCVTLAGMNSILCHATARALRLRDVGHWPVAPDEGAVRAARAGDAS